MHHHHTHWSTHWHACSNVRGSYWLRLRGIRFISVVAPLSYDLLLDFLFQVVLADLLVFVGVDIFVDLFIAVLVVSCCGRLLSAIDALFAFATATSTTSLGFALLTRFLGSTLTLWVSDFGGCGSRSFFDIFTRLILDFIYVDCFYRLVSSTLGCLLVVRSVLSSCWGTLNGVGSLNRLVLMDVVFLLLLSS